jgi:glycerate kinase
LLTEYAGGKLVSVPVRDPLFRIIDAQYGISKDGRTAFLEMAKASGLQLLRETERNPLHTTTAGTGDMICDALDRGVDHIIMGVGGSATTDAGMGMAEALGVVFYDAEHKPLSPVGSNLMQVSRIDITGVHPRLREVQFTIFCDVDNPLHGPQGAAYVFSPQKGADTRAVETLDRGLVHYEQILSRAVNKNVNFAGAGAGGGLPASIQGLTEVAVRPGMAFMIEFMSLEDRVRNADVVVTGEGKIDEQTLSGKVVKGVADLAAKLNKEVIAFAGKAELSPARMRVLPLQALITLTDSQTTDQQAMEHAYSLLRARAEAFWNSRTG